MGTAGIGVLERWFHPDPPPEIDDNPASPEPDPDATTELPAIPASGQVTYARQARSAMQHAWRAARRRAADESDRDGSWLQKRMAEQHSINGVRDYATSRAWVPPGDDGGVFEKLGVLYFALIGRRKVAYHLLQAYKYERPARWAIWVTVRGALALALLAVFHHAQLAAEIGGGTLAAFGLLCACLAPRRSHIGPDPDEVTEEEDDLS